MHTDETLAMLVEAQTQLVALGIPAELTEDNTLCGNLMAHGAIYATLHVLVAEAFFAGVGNLRRATDYHEYLYGPVADSAPCAQMPAYLLVVGHHDFIFSPEFAPVLWELEFCTSIVKKLVCSMADLQTWVTNPFPAWSLPGPQPTFTIFAESLRVEDRSPDAATPYIDLWAKYQGNHNNPVVLPTGPDVYVYRGKHELAEMLTKLRALPNMGRSQQIVNVLFRRCVGTELSLAWDVDGLPHMSRAGRGSVSLPCWSNGEQLVFSLCVFLALAHAKGAGPCSIVIHSISGLDTLRRLAVLDRLQDFVHATGSSVWIYHASGNASVINARVGGAASRVCAAKVHSS